MKGMMNKFKILIFESALLFTMAWLLLFLLSLLCAFLHNAMASQQQHYCSVGGGNSRCFPAVFVFGDSYLDVGNKAALYPEAFQQTGPQIIVSNKRPYGQNSQNLPAGRFSDGLMLGDFLAQGLGLEFPGAYLQSVRASFKDGVNFAMAGGTAINNTYYVSHNVSTASPYALIDELAWFLRFKDLVQPLAPCKKKSSRLPLNCAFTKGLYIIGEIGGNDYTVGLFYAGMTPQELQEVVLPLVKEAISHFFKILYASGARNFLFIGLPPMVESPAYRALGKYSLKEALYTLTSAHNQMLRDLIAELRATYRGIFTAFADFQGIQSAVISNPRKYGISETSSACCGAPGPFNFNLSIGCGQPGSSVCPDPNKFVYWDFSHYTEHFSQIAAKAFLSGDFLEPSDALAQKCGRAHAG